MCEDDVEDGVGPAALLVHVGGGHCARFIALRHQRLDVLDRIFMSESALTPFSIIYPKNLILVKHSEYFPAKLPTVYP